MIPCPTLKLSASLCLQDKIYAPIGVICSPLHAQVSHCVSWHHNLYSHTYHLCFLSYAPSTMTHNIELILFYFTFLFIFFTALNILYLTIIIGNSYYVSDTILKTIRIFIPSFSQQTYEIVIVNRFSKEAKQDTEKLSDLPKTR